MSVLPEELWRRILEIGIERRYWNFKDLCCVSISCRRLNRLSNEDALWSSLLSSDFPTTTTINNHRPTGSSVKSLYKFRFERDRARKLLAQQRAVLRVESQISEHLRKLQEIQLLLASESDKMKSALVELSSLRKVRQASVALNVWQPEVIRGHQKQVVEQSVVPIDLRINALEMEVKLCKQQIAAFDKTHKDETKRLDEAKKRLASVKYHPLRDYSFSPVVGEQGIRRKKSKK